MRPKKKVLLVDRDDVTLSLRSFVIDLWGYKPLKAHSATEAMKILQEHKAYEIHLIAIGDGITCKEVQWIADKAEHMLHLCPVFGVDSDISSYDLRKEIKLKTSRKKGPRAVMSCPPMEKMA